MAAGDFKRQTAYKLRIGDVLKGKPFVDNGRFMFLELGEKKVGRVNVVANVVDKYSSQEKQYVSLTIDDASGQIRIKIFGDDVLRFNNINQGDTVMLIGLLRVFNEEMYITPEIIKIKDPRYLLVRKLEMEKELRDNPNSKPFDKEQVFALADQILEKIKLAEPEGINTESLIEEVNPGADSINRDLINQEIKKAMEQGIIYEPRPGMLRYLGA